MSHSRFSKLTDLLLLILFWLYVSIPLAWGVSSTLQKALTLFK
jgi:hypothetical protein